MKNKIYALGRSIVDIILDQKENYPFLGEIEKTYIVARSLDMPPWSSIMAASVYVVIIDKALEKVEGIAGFVNLFLQNREYKR